MIRVVKVGGSLFDMADLLQRLHDWLGRQLPAHHVLVPGGGELVDEVRRRHALRPIDEEAAHWECIDFMGVNAVRLRSWLPDVPLVDDVDCLKSRGAELRVSIFDPGEWLRRHEPHVPGTRLPCGWAVSSDSIAARLAVAIGAKELVLLKSALPPDGSATPAELAAAGYVDDFFPQLAAEMPPTRLVDFRDGK